MLSRTTAALRPPADSRVERVDGGVGVPGVLHGEDATVHLDEGVGRDLVVAHLLVVRQCRLREHDRPHLLRTRPRHDQHGQRLEVELVGDPGIALHPFVHADDPR